GLVDGEVRAAELACLAVMNDYRQARLGDVASELDRDVERQVIAVRRARARRARLAERGGGDAPFGSAERDTVAVGDEGLERDRLPRLRTLGLPDVERVELGDHFGLALGLQSSALEVERARAERLDERGVMRDEQQRDAAFRQLFQSLDALELERRVA